MLYDLTLAHILFLYEGFEFVLHLRKLFLIGRFNFLSQDFERIAVGDGAIVVVSVEIVAKHFARGLFLLEEGSARECNFDGILIRIEEIGQETAPRAIAAVRFV